MKKITRIFLSFSLLSVFIIDTAFSALSATTISTIHGTKPNILTANGTIPSDPNHILHFTIPDSSGSITYFGDSNFSGVMFSNALKFNDFDIDTWDASLFTDADGDQPASPNMVTYTNLIATWVDRYNKTPNSTDNLDPCYAPYKLKIDAVNLSVNSQYGDPMSNLLGNLSHTFTIKVEDITPKACFVKPDYLGWVNWSVSGNGPPSVITNGTYNTPNSSNFGGGYETDFVPTIGFKANVIGDKFPTIGFVGAKFNILTSSSIIFDTTSIPGFMTLTQAGEVTFIADPPSLPQTVSIKDTSNNIVYSFTLKKWAIPKTAADSGMSGSNFVNFTTAQTVCSGVSSRLATRADLTSSPKNNVTNSMLGTNNVYIRKIDGSVDGEWGSANQYTDSKWMHSYYWTDDSYNSDPYIVGVNFGSIALNNAVYDGSSNQPANLPAVACINY